MTGRPLVLVAPGKGGARVVSLNRAAQQGGLVVGELLSNARSKVLDLQSRDADPAADAAALRKLALWCLRYAPIVAPWDESQRRRRPVPRHHGLRASLRRRGAAAGRSRRPPARLRSRARAWPLPIPPVRPGPSPATAARSAAIVPSGGEGSALQTLPLAALRLSQATRSLLRRLGLRRIGELIDQPRAPFAARFEPSSCAASTRRWGARPSRSSPLCRRPSIARRPCSSSRS